MRQSAEMRPKLAMSITRTPTGAVELGSRLCERFSGRKLSESYQWWNVLDGPHSTYPRTWSRSASNLGSEVDADRISTKLALQWPPSEYPVHIQISSGVAGA